MGYDDPRHDALVVSKEEEPGGADGGYGCDEDRAVEEGDACFGQHVEEFPFDTDHRADLFLGSERTRGEKRKRKI